jgi:hypothetical protein
MEDLWCSRLTECEVLGSLIRCLIILHLSDKETLFDKEKEQRDWATLVKELFKTSPDKKSKSLTHSDLKSIPKLLVNIMKTNIIPRIGDQGKVRSYELRVQYALMTGKVKYSLEHLIMIMRVMIEPWYPIFDS